MTKRQKIWNFTKDTLLELLTDFLQLIYNCMGLIYPDLYFNDNLQRLKWNNLFYKLINFKYRKK